MPPSPEPTTDRRAQRLAWLIALGLFIPIAATLAVIAFWPYPSPKPYRERALALMQGEYSALDLERGKQVALEIKQLQTDLERLRREAIDMKLAQLGIDPPWADGNQRVWQSDPAALLEDQKIRTNAEGVRLPPRFEAIDLELARRSLDLYRERGMFERLEALTDARLLWTDHPPAKPLNECAGMIAERGAIRGFVRDLCAEMTVAAERNDADTAARMCRISLLLSELAAADNLLIGKLVTLACRGLVVDQAAKLALHPDSDPKLIRALLNEINQARRPLQTATVFEIERQFSLEAWLAFAQTFTPLDRLEVFATQQPGPREWIAAVNRAHDALDAAARADFRTKPDFSDVPQYQLPFVPLDLDLHQHCQALHRVVGLAVMQQTEYDATRLLLAITLYQREQGRPPTALTDLVPDYLPSLPEDPYAPDKQFRYRVLPPLEANQRQTSFILYSVGYDAIDNNATLPIGAHDSLEPLHSDKHPNTDAIFHPRLTRPN